MLLGGEANIAAFMPLILRKWKEFVSGRRKKQQVLQFGEDYDRAGNYIGTSKQDFDKYGRPKYNAKKERAMRKKRREEEALDREARGAALELKQQRDAEMKRAQEAK